MKSSQRYKPPGWSRAQWVGGWTVERARWAIEQHDQGRFVESWALSVKVSQWSRIFGALRQRIAPTQRFPRAVVGGDQGLDRIIQKEAEGLYLGEGQALGPAFPSLWGTIESLALMGFAWWQTAWVPQADGTEAPVTELWPSDAVWYDGLRRRWVASTMEEGAIDIDPQDPRWTLVADGEEPWRQGAIRAIGLEYVDAAFTRFDRSEHADTQGRAKPYVILPPNTKVSSARNGEEPTDPTEGDYAEEALRKLQESDAGAVFANQTTVGQLEPSEAVVALFRDILESDAQGVAIAILGTDGTVSKGDGGVVYTAPVFQGVAENTIAADVKTVARGATTVLERWRRRNYTASQVALTAQIQMPDTSQDARATSRAARTQAFHAAIKAERDNGFVIDQEGVNALARDFDIRAPVLRPDNSAKTNDN